MKQKSYLNVICTRIFSAYDENCTLTLTKAELEALGYVEIEGGGIYALNSSGSMVGMAYYGWNINPNIKCDGPTRECVVFMVQSGEQGAHVPKVAGESFEVGDPVFTTPPAAPGGIIPDGTTGGAAAAGAYQIGVAVYACKDGDADVRVKFDTLGGPA